jgi:methanogenic corrinoid protein MtbC1
MAKFASRLKSLRKREKMRQVDLAKELGVAQTTIANYEQDARFPDEKTLRRIADLFQTSLDYLLGRSDVDPDGRTLNHLSEKRQNGSKGLLPLSELAKRYLNFLVKGDWQIAKELIIDSARSGVPVRDIYLKVFEPSLKEVGRLWEEGKITVAVEHFFSNTTCQIMAELHAYRETTEKNGFVVTAVVASGEHHEIGMRMVIDFLEMDGWSVYYLGTHISNTEVINAIKISRADILAVSSTLDFGLEAVADLIRSVRSDESTKQVKILVGGQAFSRSDGQWVSQKADGFARSAEEAVRVARNLAEGSPEAGKKTEGH